MNGTVSQSRAGNTPLAEAAAWQVYFESSGLDSSEAFEAWLDASKENRAAWQQVQGAWGLLDEHEQSAAGADLRRLALADADAAQAARKRQWRAIDSGRRVAAAASIIVIVGVLTAWGLTRPEAYRTSTGERRVVTLSDDSRVTLDSDTEVRVRYSEQRRELILSRGQARFDVAHDPSRPFSVHARDRQIVAIGTSFNIDALGPELLVTLLKGRVVVVPENVSIDSVFVSAQRIGSPSASGGTPIVTLAAGEQLAVGDNAAPSIVPVSAAHVTAWESGHLLFDDEPLATVVERLSHYSSRRLLIMDPRAAELRISGYFNAGDTDGFVRTVTEYLPLHAVTDANGDIRFSSR